MNKLISVIFALVGVLVAQSAAAYVGPGAGLSLLGALWALLAAIGLALFFVVAWPIRKLFRKRSATAGPNASKGPDASTHARGSMPDESTYR